MPPKQVSRENREFRELSTQQKRFTEFLLEDPNHRPVIAARKAGYKDPYTSSMDLLKRKEVRAELAKAKKARIERTHITQDAVLERLALIAFRDPRKLVDPETGTIVPNIAELPDDIALSIDSMKQKRRTYYKRDADDDEPTEVVEVETEIKMAPMLSALDMAAKHLGLYERDNAQKGPTVVVDWSGLHRPMTPEEDRLDDDVERRILEVRAENPTPQRRRRPSLPAPEPKDSYTLEELLADAGGEEDG